MWEKPTVWSQKCSVLSEGIEKKHCCFFHVRYPKKTLLDPTSSGDSLSPLLTYIFSFFYYREFQTHTKVDREASRPCVALAQPNTTSVWAAARHACASDLPAFQSKPAPESFHA